MNSNGNGKTAHTVPLGDENVISTYTDYTDRQAVEDGVLVPFPGPKTKSGKRVNRVTRALFEAMTDEGTFHGKPAIDATRLMATLIRVVLTARQDRKDDPWYISEADGRTIWLVPNEIDGYTAMFAEDY